jgi:hypothetical protein
MLWSEDVSAVREYHRNYRAIHNESLKKYHRDYYKKHSEKIKQSYLENINSNRAKAKDRYQKNKAQLSKKSLEYYHQHRDAILSRRATPEGKTLRQNIHKRYRDNIKLDDGKEKIFREKSLKATKDYRLEHPEIHNAQERARKHTPKPKSCVKCGSKDNLHRHHLNYSRPLLVIPLCASCHKRQHNTGGL